MVHEAVAFGEVDEQHDRILIVATGPSLRGLDLRRLERLSGVYTIAVKQAILGFTPDAWITVDPNERARALMRNPVPGVRYFAAVPADYGQPDALIAMHRDPPEPGVTYLRRLTAPTADRVRYGLSEDRRALHTGNSAWAALGLAYLMRPSRIGFLGLDGTQEPHAVGVGRPRGRLDHLPRLFASAATQLVTAGVEVRNGSRRSLVDCFTRVTHEELLTWLQE